MTYSTKNSTAVSGADYVAIPSTSVAFAEGESAKVVSVTVNGDALTEGNETFFVNLKTPTGAVIADTRATGTIIDDEGTPATPPPSVYITDTAVLEGDMGTATAGFTIRLSSGTIVDDDT